MLYSCLFVVLLTCLKLILAKILVSLVYIIFIYSYLISMYDNGLLLLMMIIVHTHTHWHTHVLCQQTKQTKNDFYIFQLLNWHILPCPALSLFAGTYSFHTSWNNKHPYLLFAINLIGLPKTKIATIKPRITETRNSERKWKQILIRLLCSLKHLPSTQARILHKIIIFSRPWP